MVYKRSLHYANSWCEEEKKIVYSFFKFRKLFTHFLKSWQAAEAGLHAFVVMLIFRTLGQSLFPEKGRETGGHAEPKTGKVASHECRGHQKMIKLFAEMAYGIAGFVGRPAEAEWNPGN